MKGEATDGSLYPHRQQVRCLQWSPDGVTFVSGGEDGEACIKRWREWNGDPDGKFWTHRTSSVSLLIARWHESLMGGGFGTVHLHGSAHAKMLSQALGDHNQCVCSVPWSSDGHRILAAGCDGEIRICNVEKTQELTNASQEQSKGTRCVAWSLSGSRVVSGGWNGKLQVWRGFSGTSAGEALKEPTVKGECLAWSPDGTRIIAGGRMARCACGMLRLGKCCGSPFLNTVEHFILRLVVSSRSENCVGREIWDDRSVSRRKWKGSGEDARSTWRSRHRKGLRSVR